MCFEKKTNNNTETKHLKVLFLFFTFTKILINDIQTLNLIVLRRFIINFFYVDTSRTKTLIFIITKIYCIGLQEIPPIAHNKTHLSYIRDKIYIFKTFILVLLSAVNCGVCIYFNILCSYVSPRKKKQVNMPLNLKNFIVVHWIFGWNFAF